MHMIERQEGYRALRVLRTADQLNIRFVLFLWQFLGTCKEMRKNSLQDSTFTSSLGGVNLCRSRNSSGHISWTVIANLQLSSLTLHPLIFPIPCDVLLSVSLRRRLELQLYKS